MNATVEKLLAKNIAPVVNGDMIRTGLVRIVYPKLFKPESFEGSEPKYSVLLMIPKTDKATMDAIKQVHGELVKSKFGSNFKSKNPLIKDGDESEFADLHGYYLMRVSSKRKPDVVKSQGGTIVALTEDEIKGGDWAIVSLRLYAYDKAMNKGISAGLNNLLLVARDEALGGGSTSASDDFGDISAIASLEEEQLDTNTNNLDDVF